MVAAIGTGSAAALAVSGGHVFASLISSAPAKQAALAPRAGFAPSAAAEQYGTEPTTTQLTCLRIGASNSFNCTAQVNGAAGTAPTGTVSFTSASGSFAPATCTLIPKNTAMSTCTTVFTATAVGGQILTAAYSGDAVYAPSSGTTAVAGLR